MENDQQEKLDVKYAFDYTDTNTGIQERDIFVGQKKRKYLLLSKQNLKPKKLERRRNILGMKWHKQKPKDESVIQGETVKYCILNQNRS